MHPALARPASRTAAVTLLALLVLLATVALPSFAQTPPARVQRIAGLDRIETTNAISATARTSGQATAAVLARSDSFADALAGTPLAAARGGPVLLTASDRLDLATATELLRVLDPGATVYLLGGTAALSPQVEREVRGLGYETERLFGADRFDTAIAIATRGLDDPDLLMITTGTDFPDALGAGAAAATGGGAVLLTAGADLPPQVRAYLDAHPSAERVAVGGPAAAAVPDARPLVGADRYETSARVADAFFDDAGGLALASGANFPDALSGGAFTSAEGYALLLSDPQVLSPPAQAWVEARSDALARGFVLGGTAALSEDVEQALAEALG